MSDRAIEAVSGLIASPLSYDAMIAARVAGVPKDVATLACETGLAARRSAEASWRLERRVSELITPKG